MLLKTFCFFQLQYLLFKSRVSRSNKRTLKLLIMVVVVVSEYIWCFIQLILAKPRSGAPRVFSIIIKSDSIFWHPVSYVSALFFVGTFYNYGRLKRISFKINRLTFQKIKKKLFAIHKFVIFLIQPLWKRYGFRARVRPYLSFFLLIFSTQTILLLHLKFWELDTIWIQKWTWFFEMF